MLATASSAPRQRTKLRSRYVIRALAALKPHWPLVAGAYVVVFLSNGVNIWMPLIIRNIVDNGIRAGSVPAIVRGALLLISAAAANGLFTFLSGIWTEIASQNVAFDIRNRFHAKLQSLSFSFHDQSETGQLLARSVSDVDRIRFLTGRAFLNLIQMLTLIIAVSIAMVVVDARLAFPTMIIIPFLAVSATKFSSIFRPLSWQIRNSEANLTSRLEQNLRGSRIVKAYAQEEREVGRFRDRNDVLLGVQRTSAKLQAIYMPFMQVVAGAGTIIVLIYGGVLVIRNTLTLGDLVAFSTYVTLLINPIRRLGWMLTSIAQASASAERIFEVLDLESEIKDSPDAVPIESVEGHIRFDHVTFSYARSNKVLDDIDLTILPGEKVALLGGTGSGKSSIINLIPRFYDPVAGTVLLDGRDLRGITVKSLRDHIGIVMQDTKLFAASVRENIAFGKPDASEDEVVSAARAAHADDFVRQLPEGYDTYIGEQGTSLSGGQKQRISIARAILKDPEILILDDATSSVDTETERLIQKALEYLMHNRTSIIIAQRLSTIRMADKVFILQDGKIVGQGVRTENETPHDQLMSSSPHYAEIFYRQLRPESLETVDVTAPTDGGRT